MGPLDVALFPDGLRRLYESDLVFVEWVHLTDRVRRAEKISCWTQWTPEQRAAYQSNDLLQFSRLRGYTEAEIAEFIRSMALVGELDAEHGEGFCLDVEYVLGLIVKTEALRAIDQKLYRMSEAESVQTNGA